MLHLAMDGSKVSTRLASASNEKDIGVAASPKKPSRRKRTRRRAKKSSQNKKDSLIPQIKTSKFSGRSEKHVAQDLYLALRCCWSDPGKKNLSRAMLCNFIGAAVYDSGVVTSANFAEVREKILSMISSKVVVGHGLDYCFYSLQIVHPWANIRDGASYLPFMQEKVDPLTVMVVPRPLDDLCNEILERSLPEKESPDLMRAEAAACMDLYRSVRYEWETEATKLLQQKERQKAVTLVSEQLQLASIREDDNYGQQEANDIPVEPSEAPPLTKRKGGTKINGEAGETSAVVEDYSSQAPTEPTTHDEESTKDDLSVKTKASSDASIWKPQDTASEDGSSTNASWGIWLARTETKSAHPLDAEDADDWLNEEPSSGARNGNSQESASVSDDGSFLDARSMRQARPETHPVDADDANAWLEGETDEVGRTINFGESSDRPSEEEKRELPEAENTWGVPRRKNESTHPLDAEDADDWLLEDDNNTLQLRADDDCLPSRLLNDSSSDGSEDDEEPPVREKSNHYVDGMDWLEPEPEPSTTSKKNPRRQSSWRRQQSDADEDLPEQPAQPSKFSFFHRKPSNLSSSERSSRSSKK